jgi:transcriptional regulator with XRE-family HTH domain
MAVTGPAVRPSREVRGQALRTERQAAGVSQRVVAEFAGIDRENLASIEAGRRPFSAETEARIREAIRQAADAGCKDRSRGDPLEVRCQRCDRHGRVRLTKLIEEHGDDLGLPELAAVLANRCPKADAIDLADRCFVYFPQLSKLFPRGEG